MDPFRVFHALGPVRLYRRPGAVQEQWADVEEAQDELKRRFDSCGTDGERLKLTTDVTKELVMIARRRACSCQLQHEDLACENLDIETILADWVEFVSEHLPG